MQQIIKICPNGDSLSILETSSKPPKLRSTYLYERGSAFICLLNLSISLRVLFSNAFVLILDPLADMPVLITILDPYHGICVFEIDYLGFGAI